MSFGPFPNDPGLGGNVVFGLAANAPAAGTVPAGYQYVATDTDTVTYYSATSSYTIGSGGGVTPALVRSTSFTSPGTSNPINTIGCNLIVVALYGGHTITDSNANTWTYTGGTSDTSIAYCRNPTTSSSHTFTEGGSPDGVIVAAFANAAGAMNISEVGGGGAAQSGTTISVNELVIATYGAASNTGVTGMAVSGGFTAVADVDPTSSAYGQGMSYQIKSTAGTVTATPTCATGSTSAMQVGLFSFLAHS